MWQSLFFPRTRKQPQCFWNAFPLSPWLCCPRPPPRPSHTGLGSRVESHPFKRICLGLARGFAHNFLGRTAATPSHVNVRTRPLLSETLHSAGRGPPPGPRPAARPAVAHSGGDPGAPAIWYSVVNRNGSAVAAASVCLGKSVPKREGNVPCLC